MSDCILCQEFTGNLYDTLKKMDKEKGREQTNFAIHGVLHDSCETHKPQLVREITDFYYNKKNKTSKLRNIFHLIIKRGKRN